MAVQTALTVHLTGTSGRAGRVWRHHDWPRPANAIDKAEDRRRFDIAMKKIGLDTARSGIAHTMDEALAVAADVGFPCIIRPSFTMGGTGGGIAYNREEFEEICAPWAGSLANQ
jgi:carbamoyl-phosphate synthase large subunit